jgi:hypothetical protein
MKKFMTISMAVLFLAACAGWAQTTPAKRKHTRPPYSGPRKAGTGHKKPLPDLGSHKHKAGGSIQKAKPGHIIVR